MRSKSSDTERGDDRSAVLPFIPHSCPQKLLLYLVKVKSKFFSPPHARRRTKLLKVEQRNPKGFFSRRLLLLPLFSVGRQSLCRYSGAKREREMKLKPASAAIMPTHQNGRPNGGQPREGVRLCTVPDLLAKVGKEAREKMRFCKVF